jgi:uncharacterized protein (TIGR03086 family)
MDALTDHHRRAASGFARLVASIAPDQWAAPTPCTSWSVRDLVNHLTSEALWTPPLLAGRSLAEVGDAFDGDVLGDDPAPAHRDAVIAAIDAVDAADLDRLVELSFGRVPARIYVEQLFIDHLVHTWDLARAIGADERLPEDLVAACLAVFAPQEDGYRAAGVIGPRVATSRTDPQSRLLAAFGRDPAAPSTPSS